MCPLVNGKMKYKYGNRETINGILERRNEKGKRIQPVRNDETELIDQNIVDE